MSEVSYFAYIKYIDFRTVRWSIFKTQSIDETHRETEDEAKIAYIIRTLKPERSVPKYELEFLLKERDRLLQQYPEYFV